MEAREQLEQHGFAVFERFVSDAWCERLVARVKELVAGFDPSEAPPSVFTTVEQERRVDAYFLGSGDAVRFFYEAEAFDEGGELVVPKERAINKIGHALHRHDEAFRALGEEHDLLGLAASLGVETPVAVQSMVVLKPPEIGGEVAWHQDATFLRTDPPSVLGFWLALDDATTGNGCLWAIPGGHRGPLRQRFVRDEDDTTRFENLDDTPFDTERAVAIEAPRGTLVALHGMIPHRSDANRSSVWRHAYTLHVLDRGCAYPADNWLRTPLLA